MKKQIGIYRIKNLVNGRFYIGATTDFKTRFDNHMTALRSNSHHNKPLQEDWNCHSPKDFVIEFVESCSEKDLYPLEQQYIRLLYDDQKVCYNVSTPKMIGSLISPTGMAVANIFNIRKFCRDNKVRRTSLQFMLRGLRKSANGWTVYKKVEK